MPSTSKLLEDDNTHYTVHLQKKEIITHDSRIFRFSLPSEDKVLGVPVGQHIYLSATINGEEVVHKYTPISSDDEAYGYFDLVIKVYFPLEPDHPKGGKLTQYLESLKIGDGIQIQGPLGNLTYEGCGQFSIRKDKTSPFNRVSYKKVGMIAGGTGIAPMYHLIQDVLKNPSDPTQLWLLFANHTEADILMRDRLESLAQQHPDRFKLFLTVTRAEKPEEWDHFVGHVNANMIKDTLPPPSNDTLIAMCGRKGFNFEACHPSLDQLGYDKDHRFKY